MAKIVKNEQKLKEAIDLLAIAFEWVATPQGSPYWTTVMLNLEALIDDCYRPNYSGASASPNKLQCIDIALNLSAFDWTSTEQGWDYWMDVSLNLQQLGGCKPSTHLQKKDNDLISDYDRAMGVI